MKEIERKFLVDLTRLDISSLKPPKRITQGYLASADGKSIRVRIADARACLTVKFDSGPISRDEFEYSIPVEDAQAMLRTGCVGTPIRKRRFQARHGGELWEIDFFDGLNAGLVLAEIELGTEEAPVELPPWVLEEVTADRSYRNSSLALRPYSSWPDRDRDRARAPRSVP